MYKGDIIGQMVSSPQATPNVTGPGQCLGNDGGGRRSIRGKVSYKARSPRPSVTQNARFTTTKTTRTILLFVPSTPTATAIPTMQKRTLTKEVARGTATYNPLAAHHCD